MSGYPNVNVYAAAPGSRNVISSVRSHTRFVLAHELVQAAVPQHALAVLVDVHATRAARSVAVDEPAEGHPLTGASWQHENAYRARGTGNEAARAKNSALSREPPIARLDE